MTWQRPTKRIVHDGAHCDLCGKPAPKAFQRSPAGEHAASLRLNGKREGTLFCPQCSEAFETEILKMVYARDGERIRRWRGVLTQAGYGHLLPPEELTYDDSKLPPRA